MLFKVCYSLQKDVLCYLNFVWKFNWFDHGNKDIQNNLLKKLPKAFCEELLSQKDEHKIKDIITEFLQIRYQNNKQIYEAFAGILDDYLNKNKLYFIHKLEKVFREKVSFDEINIFLGTSGIGPYYYQDKWIMVAMYRPIEDTAEAVLHELNHFMFHYYFPNLEKKLPKKEYESLKEALTVFTNPDEPGYPNQFKLREWLKTQKDTIPEIIKKGGWKKYVQ